MFVKRWENRYQLAVQTSTNRCSLDHKTPSFIFSFTEEQIITTALFWISSRKFIYTTIISLTSLAALVVAFDRTRLIVNFVYEDDWLPALK